MRIHLIAITAAAALFVAGCASNAGPGDIGANKTTIGGLLGGAGGAVAGAQFGKGRGQLASVAAGTLIGALIGSEAGKSLDRADQLYAQRAEGHARAAPIGESIAWSNPDTGHRGYVTPVREGRNQSTGEYCREFQQTVQVGGQTERAYGTACRQPDGSWRVVQ
ncbi:MAG: glycine zipper 2TM domain-containing protein [Rhodospirillales bacterium]|nr:glycine zipper 2TM domain-containing protein [Rhodospirillales bacterium]